MTRKERKYEVVAAVAKAGRMHRAVVDSVVSDERKVAGSAPAMTEISDADYRTLHLPCDALEESAQQIEKDGRKPEE